MTSNQESSADIQETEFGSPALSKQRRIIYFSSDRPPFREPAEKSRLSFRNVALLVGRISLLTCDFLGERLAGALGLKAAKYQYAIDQHHRDHKTKSSGASEDLMEGGAEKICLSTGPEGSHYGAAGEERCPGGSQERCDQKQEDTREGCYNRAYQAEELQLK
ncbi:hypothetical protein JOQ06_005101 [Pogonophryne albipinna]|uniref:Uncharacterized protein n=1 Tax=Pogonophryne albipinna TaxID=1090488 RepID=A0AAD6APU0_9TELE|nr:hypothetical protein JOQ06_005101 [Pogonophryne albipinna]